ncbi:hypothetical protein [uncultured Cohaesibacter sp.]|nr:hypothetical protein [uncultured Cohaesibacter sp.]
MKIETDDTMGDQSNQQPDRFDFGMWPSLAGLIACGLIIWFMFHFANGSY